MAPRGILANRWSNAGAITLNCICAGAIFTFPLFSPPFARNLGLTMQQTSALASAAIFGEYASAPVWGWLADRRGPGSVSFMAALLFAFGYGMLGWRYNVSVELQRRGLPLPPGQLIWLSGYNFAAGSLATFFTSSSTEATTFGVSNGELDPGRWLLFLAALLATVNTFGGFVLKELPWDEDHEPGRARVEDSGFVASVSPSLSDVDLPTEQSPLLPTTTVVRAPPALFESSQPLSTFLRDPTFWLFGLAILLSIGPCEMVMASLGGVVESLLGFHITKGAIAPDTASRALGLRRLHVQIISIANTFSRLIAGGVSDWLSYSAAPSPPPTRPPSPVRHGHSRSRSRSDSVKAYFHTPPRLSRLAFLVGAAALLSAAFTYVALLLKVPAGLWVLSVSVGIGYGTIFTLSPAVVRTVYPSADFGRNFGLLNWFSALGAVIFTPLYGVLSDLASESQKQKNGVCYGRACWHDVFVVSAISTAMAGVLVLVLWRAPQSLAKLAFTDMDPRPGPPCSPHEYWLKTSPIGSEQNPFAPLFIRCKGPMSEAHGGSASAVLLTPAPPKFLRWHEEPFSGQQITFPWTSPEKSFGLVMGRPREQGVELAEIKAEEADAGFEWTYKEGGKEVLVWKGADEETKGVFGGWVAQDMHGYPAPQLFWVAAGHKPLPEGCIRVDIVREWLIPRN